MKNYSNPLTRLTRAGLAVAPCVATLSTGLVFAATASAAVPARATTECNNAGGGCHIEDLSNPTGCHVHVGYNDRIYAHNAACGYGTTHSGTYYDYLGDF